jgi:hypothetical protein
MATAAHPRGGDAIDTNASSNANTKVSVYW